MTTNFHTHTTVIMQLVRTASIQEAIKGGLKVLGFQDHSPYFFSGDYYSTFRMKREQVPGYVDSILALKKEYKDDIEIKLDSDRVLSEVFRQAVWNFTASILLIISLWGSILY